MIEKRISRSIGTTSANSTAAAPRCFSLSVGGFILFPNVKVCGEGCQKANRTPAAQKLSRWRPSMLPPKKDKQSLSALDVDAV